MRTNTLFLGMLLLAACTGLNVKPRDDAGEDPFDAPVDGPGSGVGGVAGQAGFAGAGQGGGAPAGGAGGGGRGGGVATPTGGRGGGGGARGGTQGGGGKGGGGKGGNGGAGGATASCPAGTANPCVPNTIDTAEEACCSTGKHTRSRKCDPVTCQWGSYGDWSSCAGVQAVCTPGATSACTNSDPCGNRVCSSACAWGDCVPKSGNACLCIRSGHTDCGSNYRCGTGSHDGEWQFCLSDTCQWSTEWAACGSSNCEC